MNLKTVTLSFLLGATTATMLGAMAPSANTTPSPSEPAPIETVAPFSNSYNR